MKIEHDNSGEIPLEKEEQLTVITDFPTSMLLPSYQYEQTQILVLLNNYFDGLYHADASTLAKIFHPDASYINTMEHEYTCLSLKEYLTVITHRQSPAERNEPRDENVVNIELQSESMAFVKLTMQMIGREYLDYLTLIKTENCWRIITKVFSYQTIQRGKF